MTSRDITTDQAKQTMDRVGVGLRQLNRLCARMIKLGFPPDDPLYFAAKRARDSMQDLFVAAHYASCKSGVGVEAKEA